MKEENTIPDNYKNVLAEIKTRIAQAQVKTVLAANKEMLWLYWQIGNEILHQQKNQGWGAKVIDRLSKDIRSEFPKLNGFSVRNLKYMQKFADFYSPQIISIFSKLYEKIISGEFVQYPTALLQSMEIEINTILQQGVAKLQNENNSIMQPLVAQLQDTEIQNSIIVQYPTAQLQEYEFLNSPIAKLTWTHHMLIIDKLKSCSQIFWYIANSIDYGISSNVLRFQIESQLFERQIKENKITNFKNTLPPPQSDLANYLMKDPFIFDFVQAKEKADERDIEEQLVKHITKFLLELGQGFAFIGEQYHLKVSDKDFYIDLLFYHTKLHCYVVVELKAGEFAPEDAGQIGFYIAAVDGEVATPADNPTIGLLLCKQKNQIIAEYALKSNKSPIGVAEYELSKAVPEYLKSKLPSIEEIENELSEK